MNAPHRAAFPIFFALLLAFGAGCATIDPVTGRSVNNVYSLDEEVKLGRQFHSEVVSELKKQKAPIDSCPVRVALVNEIKSNVVAHAHIQTLPYQATYVAAPDIVNAYAFPGGKIMVFEGLWDPKEGLVQTVGELAAVIAHEIAHVNCRHSTEAMTRELLPNLIIAGGLLYAALAEDENLEMLFGGLMIAHNGLIATRYSRKDELEADKIGMMYMAQAGYDPRDAVALWERMAGAGDDQFERALSIFYTHPRDFKRAQSLRRHLPEALALYEAAPAKRDGSKKLAEILPPLPEKKKPAKK